MTKVITGVNTRWSYCNVWEPKSINGGTPKYSVSLIIPKTDTVTVEKIKKAIARNESMIEKLKTDKIAYQRAEKELAKQSASLGSYINRTAKDEKIQVASGFIKRLKWPM